jgi:GntP family gluconate:H+ symporter
MLNGPILLFILFAAILFIVIATSKFKLHPFLALILAAYGIGLSVKMPLLKIASTISGGFGGILAGIGLIIIIGTIIGIILEKSGGAITMAESVLKIVGAKRPALAMGLIGYIVSIPVFCDSGFVILNSLKNGMAKKTGASVLALSVALATGLYATHTFVPPTPGPIAAAGTLGMGDKLGLVMMFGLVVALVTTIVGVLWGMFIGKKLSCTPKEEEESGEPLLPNTLNVDNIPTPLEAFAPILVPVALIAASTIISFATGVKPADASFGIQIIHFLGQPLNALLFGLFLCIRLIKYIEGTDFSKLVSKGLQDSASILIITGAGGALGGILKASPIGTYLGETLVQYNLGIFLPFIIAASLKTAQGSSTVALITTATIIAPLLEQLGLGSDTGRVLAVMATGAGAMTVSHANDSFFWVVSEFSGIDVKTAYKSLTLATLLQGVVGITVIAIMAKILL